MKKDTKVQIIGGGTFGLSTAFYLAKDGYSDITIIDREEVPSTFSAGYDFNKIIRPEYEDQFYTNLALDAIEIWESCEFKSFYRKVGYINCNSGVAPQKSIDTVNKFYENLTKNSRIPESALVKLNTRQDFKKYAPQIPNCDFEGWSGYFNKHAGYAKAYKAMKYLADECKKLGVKFVVDRIDKLVYSKSDSKSICTGAHGGTGTTYHAEFTIIALGAHVTSLFPEHGNHVTPSAWSVAHIKLEESEAQKLRGIPVVNCRDIGFFFEPDDEHNIIKLCNTSAGWVNVEKNSKVSVPTESNDGVCDVDLELLKKEVRTFFPHLSQTPFELTKICWCCDRSNSDFVIDYHPDIDKLLFVTADSGHAFKTLPIFGKWVLGRINGTLTAEQSQRWKWFDDVTDDKSDVSWRLGTVLNLNHQTRV